MTQPAHMPFGRPSLVWGTDEPERLIQPTAEEREIADLFLRKEPLPIEYHEPLKQVLASFEDVDHFYIQEARRHGDRSRIWNTAGWLVAGALANADAVKHPNR